MRRTILILALLIVGLAATVALVRFRAPPPPPLTTFDADDLTALRMQATDLQRAVETLARSADPDPAALAALADRLQALTLRLDQMQGLAAP